MLHSQIRVGEMRGIVCRRFHDKPKLRIDVSCQKYTIVSWPSTGPPTLTLTFFVVCRISHSLAPPRHMTRSRHIASGHRKVEQMIQIYSLGSLPCRMRPRVIPILLLSAMRCCTGGDRVDRVYGLICIVCFVDNRSAGFVRLSGIVATRHNLMDEKERRLSVRSEWKPRCRAE